jgi:hypothetical protein
MVKENNEIGKRLTTSALTAFTFDTWDERVGASLWRDVIFGRSLTDAFGYAAIPALALVAATLLSRKSVYAVLAALVAFLVPFLVFTNLHIVHSYYQTANAVFIIAAAGLAIANVMRMKRYWPGLLCLGALVAGQLAYFRSAYASALTDDFSTDPAFRIANIAGGDRRRLVVGDSVLRATQIARHSQLGHGGIVAAHAGGAAEIFGRCSSRRRRLLYRQVADERRAQDGDRRLRRGTRGARRGGPVPAAGAGKILPRIVVLATGRAGGPKRNAHPVARAV